MFSLLLGINQNVQCIDKRHCNLKEISDDILAFSKTLEELLLDSNHIRYLPKGLFRLCNLHKLSLSENELVHLSPALGALVNLVELDVSKNDLPEIPDEIKFLKQLQVADFSSNPLRRLPFSIIQIQSLVELRLNDIDLTDLPSDFGRLINLKSLELRDNQLKSLPSSFVSLGKLECLDLGNNKLEQMPSSVCQLLSLRELWLDCNEICFLPKELKRLINLKCLDITENDVENLPTEFSELGNLTDFYASQNYLQFLPSSIGFLHKLSVVKVDHNRLASLPTSLGNCISIQELILKDNELVALPSSIGNLHHLKTLNADCNKLCELPSEICHLSKLTVLSLRDNCLNFLPEDIDKLKELQVLDVSGNRLMYLPAAIVYLNLKALWLSENQNQPLLKFQKDIDWNTKKDVITCYMLPQQEYALKSIEHEYHSQNTRCPERSIKVGEHCNQIFVEKFNNAKEDNGTTFWNGKKDDCYQQKNLNYSREIKQLALEKKHIEQDDFVKQKINIQEIKDLPISDVVSAPKHCNQVDDMPTISEVVNVYLHRNSNGLGLSIAGGKGSTPYKGEDQGIFVSKVIKDGPSETAGLKVEDKILKVNDVPMDNMDHFVAVQILKNAGNNIRLTCLREKNITQNPVPGIIPRALMNEERHLPISSQFFETGSDTSSPHLSAYLQLTELNNIQPIHPSVINLPSSSKLAPSKEPVIGFDKTHMLSNRKVCDIPLSSHDMSYAHGNDSKTDGYILNRLSSFEPEMTSTPLSLSRASSKTISDIFQPTAHNYLGHLPTNDVIHQYDGPTVIVTVQKPKPHAPLKPEFPLVTKEFGETLEVITESSYTETTTTRKTKNVHALSYCIEELTLTKFGGPLGLSIIGGVDQSCLPFGTTNSGIFVSRIVPNGAVAKIGKIKVGDRLLKVNGVDLRQATHGEAVSALSLTVCQMSLLVKHDPLPDGWQEIDFCKMPDQKLGIEISGGVHGFRANSFDFEDEGVFITMIIPNSAAAQDGRLQIGMRVIEVCGISILGATYEEAVLALVSVSTKFTCTVCNGFNLFVLPRNSYGPLPECSSVTVDSMLCIGSDDDSVDIHTANNDDVILEQKSIDEKVLDVVRAAERLVCPPQFYINPCSELKRKQKTTIVISKHAISPSLSMDQRHGTESTYLPYEV